VNILYVGSSADWHVDLWVKYFTEEHEVFLFSDSEYFLDRQSFKNVTIFEFAGVLGVVLNYFRVKSHRLYQFNKLFSTKYLSRKLDVIIEKHSIDVVHSHSLYYGFLVSFMRSDVPVIFTPMGSDVILNAQANPIYRFMARKAFSRANVVTGDSVLLQRSGLKIGAKSTHNYVIQNGVDASIFFPRKNFLKQDYGVEADEVLLFSPRGITPLYNIDIIIGALGRLIRRGVRVKCMFAYAFGDEYSQKLHQMIVQSRLEDNVIWLGRLTYKEMADHYNAADIVISVPSSDSSPKSVYEAMLCAKPVVVSDLEWSYELLDSTDCLERVAVRDTEALYLSLLNLIKSNNVRVEMSENAYKEACKHFSYRQNMARMESIMIDLVYGVL